MKREIKFRAWDGNNMYLPEYADREDFHIEADGTIVYTREYGCERHELTNRRGDNWELMQFTGLMDKTGKNIYEGDIFDTGHEIRFVSGAFFAYKKGQATLPYTPENHYPLYRWNMASIIGGVKVIGNIYENPELINPKP